MDYAINTPADPLRSHACVEQRHALIRKNLGLMKSLGLR
jgi:4-O-beta-D-mannosyl-D-glucose phosphorylase